MSLKTAIVYMFEELLNKHSFMRLAIVLREHRIQFHECV